MAELKQVVIPDIGDFKDVPVIEVLVKAGDEVKTEDSLVSLESDKATIEIPSPYSGLIKEVLVKPGDKVSQGTLVLVIETSDKDHTETSTQVSADELIRRGAIPPEAEVKQISAQSLSLIHI